MSDEQKGAARFVAASIDGIPTILYEWAPQTEWKPLRRFFRIGSFGTNLLRAPKAGDVLTEDHTEDPDSGTRHEELYLVVRGAARFKMDREEFDASTGTFAHVPDPTSMGGAVASEPGTALLAVGGGGRHGGRGARRGGGGAEWRRATTWRRKALALGPDRLSATQDEESAAR